ncbi:hypothetical protein M5K25_000509 [Dendrobium thyrsiflorum]|uniref:Reverse transcriptase zinc-binding domain-containing protein n=1 Tax=Dendrobium thyrsiflorum TaxID=117978 RepID=A0ABD0VTT9_DENTH
MDPWCNEKSLMDLVDFHLPSYNNIHAPANSLFTWLACKNSLKTTDFLTRHGIQVASSCILCFSASESHSHLFFECDYFFPILNNLIPVAGDLLMRPNIFQTFNFIEEQNIDRKLKHFYYLMVCAMIYYHRRARNDRMFGHIFDYKATVTQKLKEVPWGNQGLSAAFVA